MAVICENCLYHEKYYGKKIFPCNRCVKNDPPITCKDCRYRCNKKGIMPCKNFEWW